jgi:Uma2 family endonuclease
MNTHVATEASQPVKFWVSSPEHTNRLILHGISWATYESLLADNVDSHAAHFTYDQGALEIMAPSFVHEKTNRLLHDLVTEIAFEMNIDFVNAGSTTFKRADLQKGFEPDSCFYFQHEESVRRKEKIDLTIDPPPDLVIEIDISNVSLNKFPIYATLGIAEVWRYDGEAVTIFCLVGEEYHSQDTSTMLPGLSSQVISQLLVDGQTMKRTEWIRKVREWTQQQTQR